MNNIAVKCRECKTVTVLARGGRVSLEDFPVCQECGQDIYLPLCEVQKNRHEPGVCTFIAVRTINDVWCCGTHARGLLSRGASR